MSFLWVSPYYADFLYVDKLASLTDVTSHRFLLMCLLHHLPSIPVLLQSAGSKYKDVQYRLIMKLEFKSFQGEAFHSIGLKAVFWLHGTELSSEYVCVTELVPLPCRRLSSRWTCTEPSVHQCSQQPLSWAAGIVPVNVQSSIILWCYACECVSKSK